MSIIERVARAIWESHRSTPWRSLDCSDKEIEYCHECARAAIKAMREPTDAMCQSAMIAACTEENKGIEYAPKQGWRAMVDQALK